MRQEAPDPQPLRELVRALRYRDGFRFWLDDHLDRGQSSLGMTLVINIKGKNSYPPHDLVSVNHLFPVPPAAYDRRSWQRWLFDRIADVELHERCEWFRLAVDQAPGDPEILEVPYAPSHGPGNDPYLIREVGTIEDVETSFRGEQQPFKGKFAAGGRIGPDSGRGDLSEIMVAPPGKTLAEVIDDRLADVIEDQDLNR